VIAALPNEIAVELIDFFENVPGEEQYTSTKMRLLKKFTHTDLEKAELIRSMPGIGDRKPSDLMDSMLAVCPTGQSMSPYFLNEFLRRIPGNIHGHLHTFGNEDPCSLAQQADLVWSSQSSQLILHNSEDNLAEENFCSTIHNYRQKNQNTQDTSEMAGWCNIHRNYGRKAFSCKAPCSYNTGLGNVKTGRKN